MGLYQPSTRGILWVMTSIVGTIVANAYDDSPCPLTGAVTGQLDDERVEVAWGDEQYSADPRVWAEFIDELRPYA
jgi:hypothetical protein